MRQRTAARPRPDGSRHRPPDGIRPPPGPPPMPAGRGGRFSASFTRRGRPLRSFPFMRLIDFCAASSSSNSTKANPRGRPVSRSVGTFASTTLPAALNAWISSSRVTSKLRFPTKTLFEMAVSPESTLPDRPLSPSSGDQIRTPGRGSRGRRTVAESRGQCSGDHCPTP